MGLEHPFSRGEWVVLVLRDPRERLWGRLLGLDVAGVAFRGLDVKPWEEVILAVSEEEPERVAVGTRFVPLHRVESFYLDEPSNGLPSLQEEFFRRTGRVPETLVRLPEDPEAL